MLSKKFQRKKENFVCENCGQMVNGNGYTNHCPQCLWSKHVDINPGDRMEKCGGMMKPISVDLKNGKYGVLHKCIKCGFKKKNKIIDDDNFDMVIKVAGNNKQS